MSDDLSVQVAYSLYYSLLPYSLSPSSKLVKKDLFEKGTEHMTDKKKEFDISPSSNSKVSLQS